MWPVGEVLKRHVRDGLVDYAALQREQRLAFWINAYHALSLRTIIGHYPIRRGSLVGVASPVNSIWQNSGAFKEARHRGAGMRGPQPRPARGSRARRGSGPTLRARA
jgi:hypothetical protein